MPNSREVSNELLKRDILVDWRPNAGVRLSPHFYTTDQELETAVSAVDEILSRMAVPR
jgi:kynureninase